MSEAHETEERYDKASRERQAHVEAVLRSPSKKKVVVAGPGTGKTYLFKKAIAGKKKSLTLSFVNALVEELSLDLCGLSDVRTLHGYARSVLRRVVGDVNVFPKLSEVIREDAKILLGVDVEFNRLFHNRDDKNELIQFYKQRRKYYECYGFSDIIFAVVKLFEKDGSKIPTYDQILVDEFQDFNKLEVSLIELLSAKSPVLLAGDDDQALYDFKDASPDHIRERHNDPESEYSDPYRMAKDLLRDELLASADRLGNAGIRKIPIKATTIESSKGLAEDYVFITHFDDRYFITDKDKRNISDRDICKFLVALTRARKKVFLISSDVKNEPTFLTWIEKDRIERIG